MEGGREEERWKEGGREKEGERRRGKEGRREWKEERWKEGEREGGRREWRGRSGEGEGRRRRSGGRRGGGREGGESGGGRRGGGRREWRRKERGGREERVEEGRRGEEGGEGEGGESGGGRRGEGGRERVEEGGEGREERGGRGKEGGSGGREGGSCRIHRTLSMQVRERLRTAQERIVVLEDELMLANQEVICFSLCVFIHYILFVGAARSLYYINPPCYPPLSSTQIKTLKDNNKRMKRQIQQRNSVRMSMSIGYDNFTFTKEQLAMLEERDERIGDLQFSLDERTAQLEEVWSGGGALVWGYAYLHEYACISHTCKCKSSCCH